MSRLWNRVILILSAIGLFVAGTLSYAEAIHKTVPCGVDGGCAIVTSSPYSEFYGIKLAYIGLGVYLLMFGLAVYRASCQGEQWQKLSVVGLIVSGLGFGFSLYLQMVSIFGIRQICYWCLGSAAVMLLLFIGHGLLAHSGPPKESEKISSEFAWMGGSLVLALGLFGMNAVEINKTEASGPNVSIGTSQMDDIVPIAAKTKGNPDAKVTVIEFADMNCPTCRVVYPQMHKLYEKYQGKLRLAFRHFPLFQLPGHETSVALALISERAAEDGKFWDYMDKVMDPTNIARVKNQSGAIQIAAEVGLDANEVRKITSDDAAMEPYVDRVNADFTLAKDKLHIDGTPAFVVFAEGFAPKSIGFDGLENALKEEPYASLLK